MKMSKPKTSSEKAFSPDWKSVGVGLVAGMILLAIIVAAGGRLEKVNLLGAEVAFPTAVGDSMPDTAESERGIESFPIKIFDYDGLGDNEVQQGWAKLAVAYSDRKPEYIFDYDLPSDGTFGYAGLDVRFEQTQDLSDYNTIRIVLDYPDDASQSELFIKDISFQGDYFLLGNTTPPEGSLKIDGTQYTYEIPLSVFTNLDIKAVYEVGLSVDTDITQGKHSITLKQVIFVR
jgi:hypothetical protein